MNQADAFDIPQCVAGILAAAADYDLAAYEGLLTAAVARLDPVAFVREVCGPVLREAGNRWHRREFSIVQEHLLSAAVKRRLGVLLEAANRSTSGPAIAFGTLSGERHEMGSLMLAVIATSRGVPAIDLGPDLPVAEIVRFCRHVPVGAIAISIVTNPQVIDATRQLIELRQQLPADVRLWLGGQAAALISPGQLPADTFHVRDLSDFEARVADLAVRRSPA